MLIFLHFYAFQNPFIDKEQAEALEKLTDSKPGQVQKWSVSVLHKSKQIMPVIKRFICDNLQVEVSPLIA